MKKQLDITSQHLKVKLNTKIHGVIVDKNKKQRVTLTLKAYSSSHNKKSFVS